MSFIGVNGLATLIGTLDLKIVMVVVARLGMLGFDEEEPVNPSLGGLLYLFHTVHG